MDLFDSKYFKINNISLSFFGLWSFQKLWTKFLLKISCLVIMCSTIFFQFNGLFDTWNLNKDEVFEVISSLIIFLMGLGQFLVFCFNEKKLHFLLDCIKNDWKLWTSKKEFEILESQAKIGRKYSILYFGYISTALVFNLLTTLSPCFLNIFLPSNESLPLKSPYPIKFFFNHEKHLKFILIHGSLTTAYILGFVSCCDAIFAATTQHACGLFSIIRYRFKNINHKHQLIDEDNNEDRGSKKNLSYKELFYSIHYHNYAISYVKQLEALYSPFLFVSIGGNIVTISCTLVQTMIVMGDVAYFIKQAVLALTTIYHVYVLGLPVQNLLKISGEIAFDIYDSDFHEMPIEIKKLIPLIIMQSQIPCDITIGKIAKMNMETVSQILKMAFSYFTMLSSVRQSNM